MSVFLPLVAVHLAWTAAAAVVITRRTRNPASAGVWLLLVALLPAVGSLLYVLIVHLLFDVVVFLAIVHARHPGAVGIFLV